MNRKIICLALAALMLTACEKQNRDGDTSETAEIALTESLTEDISEPEPEPMQTIEFAVFDPFYGRAQPYKDDAAVQSEMEEASEKICDALTFLDSDPNGFYSKSKYYSNCADLENPLETDPMGDYTFCPLRSDIAADEDELFDIMRGCFTESYLSDDELHYRLFENEEPYVPGYKTIDGTLCMLNTYMGMKAIWQFDRTTVLSYDGSTAEIAVYAPFDPAKMAFMSIEKSDEYGWRLDSFEEKVYCREQASLLYNAVTLRADTLNKILYGGNTPENAESITVGGESYTQTDLDMTIAEMQKFFADMFEGSGTANKYVNSVYAEQDGVLYRKNGEPRRYLPEIQIDAFTRLPDAGGINGEWTFRCSQEFYDSVKDESFEMNVAMKCGIDTSSYNEETYEYERYYYLHITSELPVREYEEE